MIPLVIEQKMDSICKENDELKQQVNRLNNIINELEKTIEDYLEGCYCLEDDYDLTSMIDAYKMVLDKIKELKECDK